MIGLPATAMRSARQALLGLVPGHTGRNWVPAPRLLWPLLVLLLGACSSAPYRHEPLAPDHFSERAARQASGGFAVAAFVPGPDESLEILGVDVYARDIQPVWLEIRNDGDSFAHVAIAGIDPRYFPPAEVAWFFKKQYSREGWQDLEKRLIDLALPRRIEPGQTASGFVFTNRSPGTKAFNLDVFRGTRPLEHEQFTFFLRVPGFVPDYADVRFQALYPEDLLVRVSTAELPATLTSFGCCTLNGSGTEQGRPLNVFFIGQPLVLLRSLLRAGWAETPAADDAVDPASVHHLFGRPADGVFRRPREGNTDRSELAVWRTPVLVDGEPLWAAQVRHAVGRRFPLGERLFGVRLDPDVVEGRNYALQTFWYAQTLHQWGMATSGTPVPQASPELDFQGNPWFAFDGDAVVIWLSDRPVPMNQAIYLDWRGQAASGTGAP